MRVLTLALALVISATITPGCITIQDFDFENATETIEFVDTVLTMMEKRGFDLNVIAQRVIGMIEEYRKDDEDATPQDIYNLIYRELTQ